MSAAAMCGHGKPAAICRHCGPGILEVGKTYMVDHKRKGRFCARVLSFGDEWADVQITSGRAGAMMSYNEAGPGEKITVRLSHCVFSPLSVQS